jgi:hypothetical protein
MALARFRKVCLDAQDPVRLGTFWAAALGRTFEPDGRGEGGVFGPTPGHTLWFNAVPQPREVKHRVHLDIYARDLADLEALGASVLLPEGADRRWTVMADPEGGELCAFLREELPAERLHGLVVDSTDPAAQARWWAQVLGGDVVDDPRGFSTVEHVPGLPIDTFDFVPVPEPKSAPNRIHWDTTAAEVAPLLDAGATLLRAPGDGILWHVLADPEGNEFCVMPDS